jgi:hypothetical protein
LDGEKMTVFSLFTNSSVAAGDQNIHSREIDVFENFQRRAALFRWVDYLAWTTGIPTSWHDDSFFSRMKDFLVKMATNILDERN